MFNYNLLYVTVKCCRYCYDVMFIFVLAVIVTCPVGP